MSIKKKRQKKEEDSENMKTVAMMNKLMKKI